MTSLPEKQQAWRIVAPGEPRDVVKLLEIPLPTLKPGEMLVKVEAAAMNPHGYLTMKIPNLVVKRPRTAEMDFTGTVVNPNSVEGFSAGDKVSGLVGMRDSNDTQGSLCQYIAVLTEEVIHRPSRLSLEEAAGFTACALTAYKALFDILKVEAGQTIFVNGGSSSLGSMFIQEATAHGCIVHTACSAKNIALAKKFGAAQVFDYTVKPLHEQLKEYTPALQYAYIIDAVGTWDLWRHCEAYLVPGGTYVALAMRATGPGDIMCELSSVASAYVRPKWLGGVNRKFTLCMGKHNTTERMQALSKFAELNPIVPNVDSVFEFTDVLKAYERIMTGRASGKVVVRVP